MAYFIPFAMNTADRIEALRNGEFVVYPYTNAVIKAPPLQDKKDCYSYNDVLELMRSKSSDPRGSQGGFIGENEDLIEVLKKDSDLVSKHNTTHQILAQLLWNAIAIDPCQVITLSEAQITRAKGDKEIEGPTGKLIKLSYDVQQTNGSQYSPFYDEYASSIDVSLTRQTSTGSKTLSFGGIQIPFIYKWGFYEGNIPYRIDPEAIWDFFTE